MLKRGFKILKAYQYSWAWWHTSSIPALRRQMDLWVWGQPGLHSKILCQSQKTTKPKPQFNQVYHSVILSTFTYLFWRVFGLCVYLCTVGVRKETPPDFVDSPWEPYGEWAGVRRDGRVNCGWNLKWNLKEKETPLELELELWAIRQVSGIEARASERATSTLKELSQLSSPTLTKILFIFSVYSLLHTKKPCLERPKKKKRFQECVLPPQGQKVARAPGTGGTVRSTQ